VDESILKKYFTLEKRNIFLPISLSTDAIYDSVSDLVGMYSVSLKRNT